MIKKITSVNMLLVLLLLCGCQQENTDTRLLLDTTVTITANCGRDTLDGAFALCDWYENMLSRTVLGSDVDRINQSDEAVSVSDDTVTIINRAVYYAELSGGLFDITICPVSSLWNFNEEVIPSKDEIAAALQNVDYHSIQVSDGKVYAGGATLDLGGIAKGYIADRLWEYLKHSGVKEGILNLGGNTVVFGDKTYRVGIQKPFAPQGETAAVIKLKNKSVVTSGIYERYIRKGDDLYHHILDPRTGYPVETDLLSATVIGDCSMDCDALATVCVLLGKTAATHLIEETAGVEAVFIDRGQTLTYTSGLQKTGAFYTLK